MSKKCSKCNGSGRVIHHCSLEELEEISRMGGTTNYNPDYSENCKKCKGKGRIAKKP